MVKTTLSAILKGQSPIYRLMEENIVDGRLRDDFEFPDIESNVLSWPTLEKINIAPGMLDGVIGAEGENAKSDAEVLLQLLGSLYSSDGVDSDERLGAIYGFLIERSTITFIDSFLELLFDGEFEDGFFNLLYRLSALFATEAAHREPVKFAIAILGMFNIDEEYVEVLMVLGLAEELSKFVSVALVRRKLNDNIFELAKATTGWGRINYIDRLEPATESIRKWFLFEGYKCDIGVNHVALECVIKGCLLREISENGWSESLYDSVGELLLGLLDFGPTDGIRGYFDGKEVIKQFVGVSQNYEKTLDRFYRLCEIFFYIRDNWADDGWEQEEKDITVLQIGDIAWRNGIDWKQIVLANLKNHKARAIAKAMGVDIWDDLFSLAESDKDFDEWYALTQTNSAENYKRLCSLALERLPLNEIATGPADELGLGGEFRKHMDLIMIVQKLDSFDEIIGVELVKTALNSPVTNNRNMALRVIESWKDVPDDVVAILQKNRDIEPYKNALEKYDAIISRYTANG